MPPPRQSVAEALLGVALLHLVEERGGTRAPEARFGWPERDGDAIAVELVRIEASAADAHGLAAKASLASTEIEILHGTAGLLGAPPEKRSRADAMIADDAGGRPRHDPGRGLMSASWLRRRSQNQSSRAVIDAEGVAGGEPSRHGRKRAGA